MRVVLTNVFSDDNRGGAAITAAAIDAVRRVWPGASVSLVAVEGRLQDLPRSHRHVHRAFPDVELLAPVVAGGGPLLVLRALAAVAGVLLGVGRTQRRLREADVVIGKGGQLFRMRRSRAEVVGFCMQVAPLVLARMRGARTAVYSVTVGPYEEGSSARRAAGWVLRRLDLVVVRDRRSFEEALALGVDRERVVLAPDSVFSRRPPSEADVERRMGDLGVVRGRFGVVTIQRWARLDDVVRFLTPPLRSLLDSQAIDELLIVLQTDGKTSDRVASERLRDALGDERVRIVDVDLPPEGLMELYAGAGFTVAGRVHSGILSLIAGTPALLIQPQGHRKAHDILGEVGLESFVVTVPSATAPLADGSAAFEARLRGTLDAAEELRRRISSAIADAGAAVLAVDDRLGELAGAVASRERPIGVPGSGD